MSEIPDDIMAKARETWHDVMGFHNDRGGFVEAIARAIMEERERCAEIAARYGAKPAPGNDGCGTVVIYPVNGTDIAAAIRNRP